MKFLAISLLSLTIFALSEADAAPHSQRTSEHPRLFLNKQRAAELRKCRTTSHKHIWENIEHQAQSLLKQTPPKYKDDPGEQLWLRGVGDNMALLSFAGMITGDERYFDAAVKWAHASASYPTWGNTGKVNGTEFGLPYGHQLLGMAMLYDYGRDYLSKGDMELIRHTLISRTTRQYTAYTTYNKPYLQNHTWINITGMLASALALGDQWPQTQQWVEMTQQVLATTASILSPDGASQEGVGYWGYGMRWLIMANTLSKDNIGNDYFTTDWWLNTASYATSMLLPTDSWQPHSVNIDFDDCPRYLWWGSGHLYFLASLKRDAVSQWYADRLSAFEQSKDWQTMLWYDSNLKARRPDSTKTSLLHFDNIGVVIARADRFTPQESLLAITCGAPLGKHVHNLDLSLFQHGDLGHVHPDANHFVIFANGEYLFKNNGYVKRITKYHSTLLIDGQGMWGEKNLYFDPMPFDERRDAKIVRAESTPKVDYITGDASDAYKDEAGLKLYRRNFIFIKEHSAVIIIDSIKTESPRNLELLFHSENKFRQTSPSVAICNTSKNKIRFENLTPAHSDLEIGTATILARHGNGSQRSPLMSIKARGNRLVQITAISWSPTSSNPVVVTQNFSQGKYIITVNNNQYTF